MKSRFLAAAVVAAMMAPLGMVSQGLADGGKPKSSKDGSTQTKLYAKFTPLVGVVLPEEFRPRVKYEKKVGTKGTEEGLEAKVLFALPTTAVLDDVDATGYLVRILTGAVEKGSCVLLAKSIEFEYQSNVLTEFDVRYAAKVGEKTPLAPALPTVKSRIGDCWVDAVAPAVVGVRGVPDVALGDIVEISQLLALPAFPLIGPPTPGTLLISGVFQTTNDHGDDEDDDD
jgi:hypothetical protein